MYGRIIVAAALASLGASMSAAQPPEVDGPTAPAQPPQPQRLTAATVAAAASARLPFDAGDGETLTAAVAEGSTLILTYEVSAALAAANPPEALAQRYLRPFCESRLGHPFFADGNRLRIDSVVAGSGAPARRGAVVSSCPAQ